MQIRYDYEIFALPPIETHLIWSALFRHAIISPAIRISDLLLHFPEPIGRMYYSQHRMAQINEHAKSFP